MTVTRPYQRRREELVEILRDKGIADERVLEAVRRVPRHEFVDHALVRRAYEDEALPIGLGQTISQPFTVAYQTVLLGVRPGDRILEVGTGSGYQAAILCELGALVFSIERLRPLYVRTRLLLRDLGYQVTCRLGDGSQGWEAKGPFDGIVVTAGAHTVPEPLVQQLREPDEEAPGGRLVIPVGGHAGQTMNRIVRTGVESWERERTEGFRFVPLIPD
jgi:protein-L-isoaspartate(D-aspartate) O-methyltransferase